jgi:hypothetical protein
MPENSVQVDDYFLGEPDRCERLISILQFCSENDFSDSKILSSDDLSSVSIFSFNLYQTSQLNNIRHFLPYFMYSTSFYLFISIQSLEKGLLYRQMIDMSGFYLLEQMNTVFNKFSEFGER